MLCAQPAAASVLHNGLHHSPIHLACTIPGAAKPWHPNGPVGPRNAIITGCWWLLREIELSALKLTSMSVDTDMVSLTLPASKTDPEAKGVQRAHTCTCGSLRNTAEADEVRCAACTVLRQRATVRALFPNCSSDWPLFPTSTGQFVSKALMVQTIITAASILELPSHTHSNTDKWGGHSLRTGGVQYMCSEGVDLSKIAAIARSTYNSILAFVKQLSLKTFKYRGTRHCEKLYSKSAISCGTLLRERSRRPRPGQAVRESNSSTVKDSYQMFPPTRHNQVPVVELVRLTLIHGARATNLL